MEAIEPSLPEAWIPNESSINIARTNATNYVNAINTGLLLAREERGDFGTKKSDTKSDTKAQSNRVSGGKKKGKSDTQKNSKKDVSG